MKGIPGSGSGSGTRWALSMTPKFGQKRDLGGAKMGQKKFGTILSLGRSNLCAKYQEPSKGLIFFSELKQVEVRICVRPNFPIIDLILLIVFQWQTPVIPG